MRIKIFQIKLNYIYIYICARKKEGWKVAVAEMIEW